MDVEVQENQDVLR